MNKKYLDLKTLKDIRTYDTARYPKIGVGELKAEAVKWVKMLESSEFKSIPVNEGLIVWIKDFFNLSEEDLQEKKK